MFKRGRISSVDLGEIARQAEASEPTYHEVGASLSDVLPAGYRHDRYERALAKGEDVYDRAVEGLRTWVAHTSAGLTVAPDRAPELGTTVALAAPLGPLTAIAICRVVAIVDEPNRSGFAYGTLPGHPERGEEAFVVEREAGCATFKIVAFSRPAELLAHLGGPLTRRIQRNTTKRYLDGLAAFVATPT